VSIARVAHVLWSGRVGGIERLVGDLAAEQIGQGLGLIVAFGQAKGPFVERVRRAGARVVDLGLASGYDLRPSRIALGAAALRTADVVHLHGFNVPIALMAGRSGRPIVFTEHGNFGLGRRLGLSDHAKRRLQASFLHRRVRAIASNSRYTALRLAETYRLEPNLVTVVHNGVAVTEAGARPHAGHSNELCVAFVGRLVAVKRLDRLFAAVAKTDGDGGLRLVIAGGGPLEEDLKDLARSLNIDDRVAFLGPRGDVAKVLAAADAAILPSEGESFGLVVLEACLQGTLPIVFADGGGALEALPPDGIVVDGVDELAAAFESLRGSEAISIEARGGRAAWVRERFPISATAERYLELYRTAANGRAA
jgi:glycosyltransferase involved in cell wall biosynthesis